MVWVSAELFHLTIDPSMHASPLAAFWTCTAKVRGGGGFTPQQVLNTGLKWVQGDALLFLLFTSKYSRMYLKCLEQDRNHQGYYFGFFRKATHATCHYGQHTGLLQGTEKLRRWRKLEPVRQSRKRRLGREHYTPILGWTRWWRGPLA